MGKRSEAGEERAAAYIPLREEKNSVGEIKRRVKCRRQKGVRSNFDMLILLKHFSHSNPHPVFKK